MQKQTSANFIIGLIGPYCSGVSTFAAYLRSHHNLIQVSLADIVKEKSKTMHKKDYRALALNGGYFHTTSKRQFLQTVGNSICYNGGKINSSCLAELAATKVDLKKGSYVITGFRRPAEVEYFRDNFPSQFFLLGVDSSFELRKKRYEIAYGKEKSGLDSFFFEDQRDRFEYTLLNYGQNVQKTFYFADYFVQNAQIKMKVSEKQTQNILSTNAELLSGETKGEIDRFLSIIKNMEIKQTPNEFGMSIAFLASLQAMCKKRYVGAALFRADENFLSTTNLISVGFNAPPQGLKECNPNCYRAEFRKQFPLVCNECKKPIESGICLYCGNINQSEVKHPRWLDECKAVHAEERAILQVTVQPTQIPKNSVLFVTTFPCNLCAKKIIETGISKLVYWEPYPMPSAKEWLKLAKVPIVSYQGVSPRSTARMFAGRHFEKIPT
ncbi:MAG: hypothetical protein HQM08_30185 [Candidatus Riflebacteria bacterium]|nr:hypothetical protein [Candidatus Riflebacteria bacterium]